MSKPRLAVISHMVGDHFGYIPTQGLLLSNKFADIGYTVVRASTAINRLARLFDMLNIILKYHHQIDIVIVDVYGNLSFIGEYLVTWLAHRLKKSIILCLRSGKFPEFMERHQAWARQVMRRANGIMTPSPFLARAIEPYGFPLRIIPNQIDLEAYPVRLRAQVRPHLFWMRSFYPYYNPMLAVKVLENLLPDYPDATLVMAGTDKGQQAAIRAYVNAADLQRYVRFAGFLDLAGKLREAAAADIFLNTNQVDNMPVGVLEACAFGLPVVATRVGGIPDMLRDGDTALLVPDGDVQAMADAVRRLVEEPVLAAHLSSQGRRLAEQCDWPLVKKQWEALFQQVLEG